MAKLDEISSTEKLLNAIRNKDTEPLPTVETPPSAPKPAPPVPTPFFSASSKKPMVIGIDIGPDAVYLVAVSRISDKAGELVACRSVPIGEGTDKESPAFQKTLRSSLMDFCRGFRSYELWATISSASVGTRWLVVPKVSGKQLSNAVKFAYRRESSQSERLQAFDYRIHGETVFEDTTRLAVLAFNAPTADIERIQRLFQKIGFPLTGVTTAPFAVENIFRAEWNQAEASSFSSLYIGREWSRIAVFDHGRLVLCRDVKTGTRSMIESIQEYLEVRRTGDSITTQGGGKEASQGNPAVLRRDFHIAKGYFEKFVSSDQFDKDTSGEAIDGNPIFRMVRPAMERIIRQLERTFEHYRLNFGRDPVGQVFISGLVGTDRRLVEHFSQQLNMPVAFLDPLLSAPSYASGLLMPASAVERDRYAVATGLALAAAGQTPNLLYTYLDREREGVARRIKRGVSVAFVACLLVIAGAYIWQSSLLAQRNRTLSDLRGRLDAVNPMLNQRIILNAVEQTGGRFKQLARQSRRYLSLAVLNEINDITPDHIRLTAINALFAASPGTAGDAGGSVVIDGWVLGDPIEVDDRLARYMTALGQSPLLRKASLKRRTRESLNGREALRFSLLIDIE